MIFQPVIPFVKSFREQEAAVETVRHGCGCRAFFIFFIHIGSFKLEQRKPFCNKNLCSVLRKIKEVNGIEWAGVMLLSVTRWLTRKRTETLVEKELLKWSNLCVCLPVCRSGGAPPLGTARDSCVPPLPPRVSPCLHFISVHTAFPKSSSSS